MTAMFRPRDLTKLTPGKRKWLTLLSDGKPHRRSRYGAFPAAQCVRAGWTESHFYSDYDGEGLSPEEAVSRRFVGVHVADTITVAGQQALSAAEPGDRK